MGRDVSWMYMDDADEEDESAAMVNLPAQWAVDEAAHQILIARSMIDVIIDAQDFSDLQCVAKALEGVSDILTRAGERLNEAVTGDE